MGIAILMSIIFVVINIIGLYKGTIWADKIREMKILSEEFLYDDISEKEFEKGMLAKFTPIFIGGTFFFIAEISFLLAMINEEGMLLPTAAMLVIVVIAIFHSLFKKKDLKAPKNGTTDAWRKLAKDTLKAKTRTVRGMVMKSLHLVYYAYVLLVLLGL
jgi:hypothetical protein